jgi:hypothetical protein
MVGAFPDLNLSGSAKNILLVLYGIGMHRHTPTRFHYETSHREIRALISPNQDLTLRSCSSRYIFGGQAVHVSNRHDHSWS